MMKANTARVLTALFVLAAFLTGSTCRRTVVREGVKVPVGQAQRMDLEKARRAVAEQRYDEAIRIYRKFMDDFPRGEYAPAALVGMGEAYFKKGDCRAARLAFSELLERFPREPEAADAAWGIALCAYKTDDCALVTDMVSSYRNRARGRRWDQMTLLAAECEKRRGDTKAALRYYAEEKLGGYDQELVNLAKIKAEILVKRMDDDALQAFAREYRKGFPGDLAALELASRAMEDDDYERAEVWIEHFNRHYPESEYEPELIKLQSVVERWQKVESNRIGVLLPLTGSLADIGDQAIKGVMLAARVFEPISPVYPPEIMIKDTGEGSREIEEVVESLVNDDHVIAIVGPLRTDLAEKAAVAAQELGVPMIALSPGDGVTGFGDMIYQNCLTKTDQVNAVISYCMRDLGIDSFGIIYPDDDYGREFKRLFVASAARAGAEIVDAQLYSYESTDFQYQIKQFKDLRDAGRDIPAVFVPDSWIRLAMIAPQVRFYDLDEVRLLGVNAWHTEELIGQTQPDDLEGVIFPDGIAPEADRPNFNSFTRRFKQVFKTEPGLVEAQAYEAVDLLVNLLDTYSVKDRTQLKKALDHVENYPGVLGRITIGQSGKFNKPVYIFTITGGRIRLVSWVD